MLDVLLAVVLLLILAIIALVAFKRGYQEYQFRQKTRFPDFYWTGELEGVPVFTFHSVGTPATPDSITPEAFTAHLEHLSRNDYHTLTADEFYAYLVDGKPVPDKSVVLTFDDGRATLWTIAYPLLKRYGFKAVTFLNPNVMPETGVRPNLDDPSADLSLLSRADLSDQPTISWEEARLMHDSGVIDFQSHTAEHSLIYCSSEIVDFYHPAYDNGYGNYAIPMRREGESDVRYTPPAYGTPIYRSMPRMSAPRRYFDDAGLRQACVEHVTKNGGNAFFQRNHWRDDLIHLVEQYRAEKGDQGTYETHEQQRVALREDLQQSKEHIESHLKEHTVRHLCFPWHRYSVQAMGLAIEAGFVSCYIDVNPHQLRPTWNNPYGVQRHIPTNHIGDDPFLISRIDVRNDMILSLPGEGRLTGGDRTRTRLFRIPQRLKNRL